jgi:hypothetical protein
MTLCLVCLLLPPTLNAEPPQRSIPLMAEEDWYKKAKESEKTFLGVMDRTPTEGRLGGQARFNTYRLVWKAEDKVVSRELHVPGKAYLLTEHLGKRVRIFGKAVDVKSEDGTFAEIWPARLEFTGDKDTVPLGADGILARSSWQPAKARKVGFQYFLIRNSKEAADLLNFRGDDAEKEATLSLAKQLNVDSIDWKNQMAVTVCAGLKSADEVDRLTIVKVAVKEKTLTITYQVRPPIAREAGFWYPAETVLIDQFEGAVRLEEDKMEKNGKIVK